MSARKALAGLLYLGGVVQLLAVPAILFPFAWMAEIHGRMGLGELPDLPITGYLTRSLSALYAAWGALYVVVATDVIRYLPLIRFLAWLKVALAATLLAIDAAAGMPWFWTALEGPTILVYAAVLLWLIPKVAGSPPQPPG